MCLWAFSCRAMTHLQGDVPGHLKSTVCAAALRDLVQLRHTAEGECSVTRPGTLCSCGSPYETRRALCGNIKTTVFVIYCCHNSDL